MAKKVDIKLLTVSEVMDNIAKGKIKVEDVAKAVGRSKRTVQSKIKNLGYQWNSKNRLYEPVLESYNSELDTMIFNNLFDRIQIESLVVPDKIDFIISDNESERVQRAYHIDSDLVEIMDKISFKQKSNLVNECLRKVFKEKGLL